MYTRRFCRNHNQRDQHVVTVSGEELLLIIRRSMATRIQANEFPDAPLEAIEEWLEAYAANTTELDLADWISGWLLINE